MENLDWSKQHLDKGEAAARGAQIKYLLGVKDGCPITSEQLKYAKNNCERFSELDRGLQTFLYFIIDFDAAADWLSINSYSLECALNLLDYDFLKHPHGIMGL